MINEIYLKKFFQRDQIPHYPCPRCGAHMKSELSAEEDRAYSKQYSHIDGYSHDDEESIFHIKLECTHPKCGEPVFLVGKGTVAYEDFLDEDGNLDLEYITYFEPKFFIPNLCIFNIPKKTPYRVTQSVIASFNLFFISSNSALNEIRNAVEFLMDELKVPRLGSSTEDPDVKVRWDLDTRVGKLTGEHRKYKSNLQAIKNLGNLGSHAAETTRDDVLNAYKILHYVLDGIYDQRDQHVTDLTRKIKADKRTEI